MVKSLTPDEVRELEAEEVQFFYLPGIRACSRWFFDPEYPVASLWDWGERRAGEGEVREIRNWWENEKKRDLRYFERFERAWIARPGEFPPIVIAELPDGRIDVGDGWHRIAMALLNGPPEIQAFVGRECVTSPRR